ncbi:MAG: cupin domain-containing protein [Selenomonadaceae bacterium]|nr:cupin domain-containing protein [Selenomonadaceae bacterium]
MAVIKSEVEIAEKKAGGKGKISIERVLTAKELGESAQMFAKVTIPKGASIGKHQHVGTTETYHILEGSAKYTDNDEVYEVKAGDTTFCADGDFHGIENAGENDLVFMALILKC